MATSEATDEGSRKRHRLFSENCDEFSSEIKDNQVTTTDITAVTDTSSQTSIVTRPSSSKNIPRNRHQSRPFSEVWDYFNKGIEKNNEHYKATSHLSNDCVSCPDDISLYWREKVAERDPNYARKPKKNCVLPNSILQTTMNSHYALDHPLSKAITNWLD
ncbi:15852_t:CDS:2 [Cetraspora pellucida]|uniref:15852_t:CDS:1 n=1 Tax=Cetraspora pellucida TaxID=1433469 RepID=A0ACA9L5Q3_9GLOM|nr:15852_t:CDS:2 [Cetraspora pellucida]